MIGIITFQDTTNFGAMLQAYALQQALKGMGQESEIINYENEFVSKNEKPIRLSDIKSLREFLRFLFLRRSQVKKYKKFKEFQAKYIRLSNDKYDKKNITISNSHYDILMAGSDQIWNGEITNFDFSYFLDFAENSKKIVSYASSLGGYKIPQMLKSEYYDILKRFDKICVREKDGAEMLNSDFGLSADVVVDPTLLLSREEWEEINNSERIIKEEYVLVYFIDRTRENFRYIKNYARKNKLKVIYLQNFLKTEFGMKNNRTAGPLEFLNLIRYANVVFTGSFHGLCFSLIYNKNFYMTSSPARGRQGRITNLLENVEISYDCIDKMKICNETAIDYSAVNLKMEQIRNESLAKLRESVYE